MKKLKIAALLSLLTFSPAEAQTTRSGMLGYNTTTFTNCGTNCITGTQINIWNATLVNSVGFIKDNNIWTGRNIFSNTLFGAINLAPAVPPATPQNGDMWVTSTGIYAQINGVSYDLLSNVTYFSALSYGLIGDGSSHPLSTIYSSLAAAQAVCPAATSLTQEADWCAIQEALNLAQVANYSTEEANGTAVLPAGYAPVINNTLKVSVPLKIEFDSLIYYTPTTGDAMQIGATPPIGAVDSIGGTGVCAPPPAYNTNGRNTGYHIWIAGFSQTTGNSGIPTSVNSSGASGVHVMSMMFSTMYVGRVDRFTQYGIFLDATCTVYGPQNTQGNYLEFNQISGNGYGLFLNSSSRATGNDSAGGNRIYTHDIYDNYINIQSDVAGFPFSTSNTFVVNVADAAYTTNNIINYSDYNVFDIGTLYGSMVFGASATYNIAKIKTPAPPTAGSICSDSGNNNWCSTGMAGVGILPAGATITSGTVYQNNFGFTIVLNLTCAMTPDATHTGQCNVAVGPSATPGTVMTPYVTQGGIATDMPVTLVIPPKFYYSFTAVGNATIGGAYIMMVTQ